MATPLGTQILGSGVDYPFKLNEFGRVIITPGVDLIKTSIRNILVWNYGSRFFIGQYGSKLYVLLDEPNDDILIAIFRQYVVDAISTWEKRIILTRVELTRVDPTTLECTLEYNVISTQQQESYIFPFYTNIAA